MQTIVRYLLIAVVIALASSCASTRNGDTPYERLAMEAIHRFGELRQAGKLPGLTKDEHGNVETEAIPESEHVTYPVGVILNMTTKAQESRYGYSFTKDSEAAQWRLTRAWRVGGDGRREDLRIE